MTDHEPDDGIDPDADPAIDADTDPDHDESDYDRDLPVLTTARLRLRPLAETDVPALFDLFSTPEVMAFWSTPPLADEAGARTLLREIREEFADAALMEWGLERLDADGLIGTCSLAAISFENRRAEIGYALHPSAQGHGYMAEALTTLIAHAFDDLGLHRLEADVDPRNAASLRALDRFGFVREGLLRERWQVTGEVQDSVLLGLLAPDWRAARGR